MTKYYLDTAIWRDLHENRTDRFRPLGEWSFELIRKIREEKHTIIYSEYISYELSKGYKNVNEVFRIAIQENLLEKVDVKNQQITEAISLCKKLQIPYGDCLHAILARDNGAILVTRDKDFDKIGFVTVKKPEELI